MIKKLYLPVTEIRREEKKLLQFISSLKLSSTHKLIDVGCGHGKKLKLLQAHGLDVVGVEINPDTVRANLEAGFKCMTVSDFNNTDDMYDFILMSHVIEHFQPGDLVEFMDGFLDRLRPGGHLIIVTPLLSPYFYDDFDHVKPYNPVGINMVFGNKGAQVQYYSRNHIELEDVWFRRAPFQTHFSPVFYVTSYSRLPFAVNIGFALLFRLSFGLIGRRNGWMGLYRKLSE